MILSPGRPERVLDAYGCSATSSGLYDAVPELALRVVVLAELPRTRDTVMLRLLGKGAVLREALVELAALPDDAWEKGVALPLLVHFRLIHDEPTTTDEDDVSAEIQAWFRDYQQQQQLREEARKEGLKEGREEGERALLLRLLRARFGALPDDVVARVEAADVAAVERWSERILTAPALDAVFAERG